MYLLPVMHTLGWDLVRALEIRAAKQRERKISVVACSWPIHALLPSTYSPHHTRLMSDSRKERLLKLQQQRIAKDRKSQRNVRPTVRAWNVSYSHVLFFFRSTTFMSKSKNMTIKP